MFGGFLSLMRVLSNFTIKEVQAFFVENSMIKRLYSILNEDINSDLYDSGDSESSI